MYNKNMKNGHKKLKSSGKKRCEICNNQEILVTHHINGRKIPKPNHKSNLVDICSNCHMEVHYGKIIIEKWLMTSEGFKLYWHKEGEESFTGEDSSPNLLV